jgi:hypothetical protein
MAAIIDLDEAAAAPGAPSILPRGGPRGARPAWIAIVLLATMLVLAGAAPPAPRITLRVSVAGQPGVVSLLGPGALFTASFDSTSVIRRWDLDDGRLSWSATVSLNAQILQYDSTAHILLADPISAPRKLFLDADTGALLREDTSGGGVMWMSGGRLMMEDDVAAREQVRLLDDRTGQELWHRTVDATAYLGLDVRSAGDTPRVVTAVAASGHAVAYRYADGAVLAQADLRLDPVDPPGISATADLLFVSRGRTLTAFSTGSFTRRWQSTGLPAGNVSDCGPVLCLNTGGAIVALDPVTGRVLWRRAGLVFAYSYDGRTLFAPELPDAGQSVELDPVTGRVLRRLGPTDRIKQVLLRTDAKRDGRTWVELVGPDGTPRVVGRVDDIATVGCTVLGRYLACPNSRGTVEVWELPDRPDDQASR